MAWRSSPRCKQYGISGVQVLYTSIIGGGSLNECNLATGIDLLNSSTTACAILQAQTLNRNVQFFCYKDGERRHPSAENDVPNNLHVGLVQNSTLRLSHPGSMLLMGCFARWRCQVRSTRETHGDVDRQHVGSCAVHGARLGPCHGRDVYFARGTTPIPHT